MPPPKAKTATAQTAAAATASVRAVVPVNYDGTLYGPDLPDGDTFDCRAEDLQQLKDVGAVIDPTTDPATAE